MTGRTIRLLAALTALALLPASAAARTPRVTLRLPTAGHMTVAALEVDATAKNPKALPRRVTLGAPKLGKLPPGVKVLFATRSMPIRHGRRYAAIVFVVRKAKPVATAGALLAHAADDAHEPNIVDLIFEGGGAGWGTCTGCGREKPTIELDDGICTRCFHARATSQVVAIQNADRAKRRSRTYAALNDLFKRDFAEGGDPTLVFGGNDHPPDPTLDTGHYDDGHSFGWGTPKQATLPPADVIRVEIDLVEDLMDRQPGKLVTDLEVATAVDLNGDGAIGPKQRIDTRVGPPIIT